MTWAIAHRIINSVAIFLIAMALFAMLDRVITILEHEYTLPQCEVMLFESLCEREAPTQEEL